MTQLRYAIVDVFAEAPLQGNPAAIVFDADALDGASTHHCVGWPALPVR